MNQLKLISITIMSILLTALPSCSSDDDITEETCTTDIIGFWDVIDFAPSTSNCGQLISYQFMTTDQDNILSVTIINGDQTLSGSGLIDEDCSQLTYTVQAGQTIESGDIRFSGTTFEDVSGFGCIVNAEKR